MKSLPLQTSAFELAHHITLFDKLLLKLQKINFVNGAGLSSVGRDKGLHWNK